MKQTLPPPGRVRLVQDVLSSSGGAERVFRDLAGTGLFSDVHICAWDRPEDPPADWTTTRRTHERFTSGGRHLREISAACEATLIDQGKSLIATHHFGAAAKLNPWSTHVYVHTPTRALWEPHLVPHERRAFSSSEIERLRSAELRLLVSAIGLATNSSYTATRIRKIVDRPVRVIEPASELWKLLEEDRETDTTYRGPAGRYVVIVGRLVEHKRYENAIDASRECGLPVVVVGRGRHAAYLRSAYSDSLGVHFAGEVTDAYLARLVAESLCLICTSVEDFGLTVAEALTTGTPVVVPDVGGPVSFTDDRSASYYSTQSGVGSVKEAIARSANLGRLPVDLVHQLRERFSIGRFSTEVRDFMGVDGDAAE